MPSFVISSRTDSVRVQLPGGSADAQLALAARLAAQDAAADAADDAVATAADRAQTGLDRVATGQDRAAAADSAASAAASVAPALAHIARTDNPHATTPAQIGAPTTADLAAHTSRTDNPHAVTAAQTSHTPPGAGAVPRSVQSKLREVLSPADYGALVNDAATVIPAEIGAVTRIENAGAIPHSVPVGATAVELRADGVRVTRPVNPVAAPTGGASVTVSITQHVDRLEYFDRADVLDRTGESFDAPGLPAGYYRVTAGTVGTRPRPDITSGVLSMFGGAAVRMQQFTSDIGEMWTRRWSIVGNEAVWGPWVPSAFLPRMDNGDGIVTGSFNFNDLTSRGIFRRNNGAGTATNPPSSTLGAFAGVVEVLSNDAQNYVIQRANPSGDTLFYQRIFSGGTWTAWTPIGSVELRGTLTNSFESTFKPPGIWGFQPDGQGNITGNFPSNIAALKTGLLWTIYRGGGAQREILMPVGQPYLFSRTNTGGGQPWTTWAPLQHGWLDNGDDRTAAAFDFNALTRAGSYWRDGTASNGPVTPFRGTIDVVANTDGSHGIQRAVAFATPTLIYQRTRDAGVWGAWRTFTGA